MSSISRRLFIDEWVLVSNLHLPYTCVHEYWEDSIVSHFGMNGIFLSSVSIAKGRRGVKAHIKMSSQITTSTKQRHVLPIRPRFNPKATSISEDRSWIQIWQDNQNACFHHLKCIFVSETLPKENVGNCKILTNCLCKPFFCCVPPWVEKTICAVPGVCWFDVG